jgi:serine protease
MPAPPSRRPLGWLALAGLVAAPFVSSGTRPVAPDPQVPKGTVHREETGIVVDLVDGSSASDLAEVGARAGVALAWLDPRAEDEALAIGHVADAESAIALLRQDPRVEAAESDVSVAALGFPDDPLYERQWNLRAMGAPAAWAATPRGRGVVVAVVDTGVARVEDLAGTAILEGASFVPDAADATDDQGHGTHVAGTIAQTTNNGIGVAGIAPEATILPVKVLDRNGSGQAAWVAAGIDWAADNGADVINLSLGGEDSDVIHVAVEKARASGVLVVAAAGNSGRKGVGWPGALPEVIGVAAVGPGGDPAPYSSWGEGVDIAAPGGDKRRPNGGIVQDTIDGAGGHAYTELQGTSMASPHVAGAAAILLSTGLPVAAVEELLLATAEGSGQWDEHLGWGQLDLGRAVGREQDVWGASRFALAMALAGTVAWLGRAGGRYAATSAVLSGLVASGAFFLPHLPVGGRWVSVASQGVLALPAAASPQWMHFPLWLAAGIPIAAAFTLGAFRGPRAVAAGLCAGIGAGLLHGAATGSLAPWWLGERAGTAWLAGNALLCVLLGLALAGAHRLERKDA